MSAELLHHVPGLDCQPPPYVAEQLGHSPATLMRDCARVWVASDPSQRISAEAQIERVRSHIHR